MLKFLENTRHFFIGIIKILLVSKFKNLHKKIKPTVDEVIILGNGPSLNDLITDQNFLDRIKEIDAVAVNAFCFSECFERIKPKYYVLATLEFWADDVKENFQEYRLKIFNNLVDKVDWDLFLFIPWAAKKKKSWQTILGKNEKIHFIYYNIIAIEGSTNFKKICFDKKLGLPRLHNVVGPSIMNMIWLNYKKIYLVGVEHSWLPQIRVDENNNALVGQPHFYDNDAKPEKMNGVDGIGHRRLHEILHKFYLSFKGYFEVQTYAQSKGVEILNLTPDSFIDAFPRQKLDIFIKKTK